MKSRNLKALATYDLPILAKILVVCFQGSERRGAAMAEGPARETWPKERTQWHSKERYLCGLLVPAVVDERRSKNQDDCQLFPRKRCSNYQGLWFRCRPVAGMGDPEIDGGGCSRRVVAKSVPHASRLKSRKQVVNARVVGARLGQRELLYLEMGHGGGRSRVQGRGDVRGD